MYFGVYEALKRASLPVRYAAHCEIRTVYVWRTLPGGVSTIVQEGWVYVDTPPGTLCTVWVWRVTVDLTMHVSRPERPGFYPGLSY